MRTIILLPSEISYSQETISCYFDSRGGYSHKKIGETLDDICEGRISMYTIPRIRVCKEGNKWVTADNRRLWVFKHLERLGKCRQIQVNVVDFIKEEKRNSKSGGTIVRVRGGDPGGSWYKKPDNASPVGSFYPKNDADDGLLAGLILGGVVLLGFFLFGK